MPFQGLKRHATDIFKGGRDNLMDALGIDYPEQLFIKSMTGGAAGDGTIRELPPEVLRDIRTQFDRHNVNREFLENELAMAKSLPKEERAPWHDIFVEVTEQRLKRGDYLPSLEEQKGVFHTPVSMYGSSRDAHLGLGTVQAYRQPDGSMRITDTWDVDNPNDRFSDGRIKDLGEGGIKATMAFDAANTLGTYRPMPIDVQLTADEWKGLQRSRMDQILRQKNMDVHDPSSAMRGKEKAIYQSMFGSEVMGPAGPGVPMLQQIDKFGSTKP